MSDLKAKMHQNRLQRSPNPLAGFKEAHFYGEGGGEGARRGGNGEEGRGPRIALVWAPEWLIRPCTVQKFDQCLTHSSKM